MALPIVIPIILGAAGIGLAYEMFFKKPAAAGTAKPGAPGAQPAPGAGPGPSSLPQQMPGIPGIILPGDSTDAAYRQKVHDAAMDLLANGTDPAAMDAVANELGQYGFTTEAAALHARAAALRAAPPVAPQPVSPNVAPSIPTPPPVLTPGFAVVTTSGPAGDPMSDLKIHSAPDASSPAVGGATKNGTVTIVNWSADPAGQWAQIVWLGDASRPAAAGYASKQFLVPSASGPVGPAPQVQPVTPAGGVGTAVVTTSGPAGDPMSDLKVHDGPSASANTIGGATKNGTVTVLNWHASPDDQWAQIAWAGDASRPAVTGYASKAFLKPTPGTTISGNGRRSQKRGRHAKHGLMRVSGMIGANGRTAKVLAPAGAKLRSSPAEGSNLKAMIPAGTTVALLKIVPGKKVNFRAPGPGGWAQVSYKLQSGADTQGWLHSEWLALDA
jgi:hypothetical protein